MRPHHGVGALERIRGLRRIVVKACGGVVVVGVVVNVVVPVIAALVVADAAVTADFGTTNFERMEFARNPNSKRVTCGP